MYKAILKKYWKILLSMVMVCTLGISVLTGLSGSHISLKNTIDRYLDTYGYPDAVITTEVTDRRRAEDLLKANGVRMAEARLAGGTVLIAPNGRYLSARIFTYQETEVQKFVFWGETAAEAETGIYIERDFADENGLKAGDTVQVYIDEELRDYVIQGVVSRPETLSTAPDSHTTSMSSDFGYLYVPVRLLENEANPDYDAAAEEIEKKEQELKDAKTEAESVYLDAIRQIEESEAELNRKIGEFRSKVSEMNALLKEADAKEAGLAEKRQELLNNRALLSAKEAEARAMETDLLNKKEQAEEVCQSVYAGLKEADETEADLFAKNTELIIQRDKLVKQKAELDEAISLLIEAKEGLQKIDEGIAAAEEASKQLKEQNLVLAIRLMRMLNGDLQIEAIAENAQKLLEFADLCRESGIALDLDRPVSETAQNLLAAAEQIKKDAAILSAPDAEELVKKALAGDQEVIQSEAYADIRTAVSHYVPGEPEVISVESYLKALERVNILNEQIEEWNLKELAEAITSSGALTYRQSLEELMKLPEYADMLGKETGREIRTVKELVEAYDALLARVETTLEELRTKRAEIVRQLEEKGVKETEIDAAVQKAVEGIAEIDKGIALIDDGLRQIAEGLDLINEKRAEAMEALEMIDSILAEINDGLRQITEGLAELAGYYAEIDNGLKQIEDGLNEIETAKKQITSGLADAQSQIASARSLLEDRRGEAEDEWAKTLLEFADLRKEIEKARNELGEFSGYQDYANQFLLYFDEGADPEEALAEAEKLLGDVVIKDSYTYERSGVKSKIDKNLDPIRELSYFIPILFYAVIMLVTFLFMSLLVRQCRREIGILRAIGFSRKEIRRTFCLIGGGVALLSLIPGLLVAYALIVLIGNYFRNFFSMPFALYRFDPRMVLVSVLVTCVTVEISTLIGTELINRIQPAEAMARQMESAPEIPPLAAFLTRKAKELTKFNIISMLRNRVRFAFTVLCIAATGAMIISSLSFIASKNYIVKQTLSDRIRYDARIYWSSPPADADMKDLRRLPYVTDAERISVHYRDVSFHDNRLSLQINSLSSESSAMVGLFDEHGNAIRIPEAGIVLDRYSAESLGAKVGDIVRVGTADLEITALSDQCIDRIQYVSRSTAKQLGEETLGSALICFDREQEAQLMSWLRTKDGYLYTVFSNIYARNLSRLYETYDLYAWILIWFSIMIGFVIVLNITRTNLLEQQKEICILRTLGFTHRELSANLFIQSLVTFICACLIGLPPGTVIARHALNLISTDDRCFRYATGVKEVLLTASIILLYIVISHLIAMRAVRKWDLVEQVKDKE